MGINIPLGKLLAKAEEPEVRCKKCGGKTVKAGARKTAQGPVQKYHCLRRSGFKIHSGV
jgi:hypothetical protein